MKNIIISICFICLISCKNELKTKEYREGFVVKMNIRYLKNDRISVFYTEDYKQDFFPIETVLISPVKGQHNSQWISFEFPLEVSPERIKIRFSNNKNQKEIQINKIQFFKNNNMLKLEGERFLNYFNFSKFISSTDGHKFLLKTVNGVYDPNIVSSSQLDIELIKL